MNHVNLALVGFGNVGRATAAMLLQKRDELKDFYAMTVQVNGIATSRHGTAMDPNGIDLAKALALFESGQSIDSLSALPTPSSTMDFVRSVPADVLLENSPVSHEDGQPAIDHIRTAFQRGMHVITANKGPVAFAYRELSETAARLGLRFMYESTVMDGAPIFSMFRAGLPATHIQRVTGILNSTTNMVLEMMENGSSFAEAVRHCQELGVAETDPSGDIEGWDAAIKLAILVTVLMGEKLTPQDIDRTGIGGITPAMINEALQAGERWKLVCTADRVGDRIVARVAPQRLAPSSHLYSIRATGSCVEFDLDWQDGIGIYKDDSGVVTTAYGLLSDLINMFRCA